MNLLRRRKRLKRREKNRESKRALVQKYLPISALHTPSFLNGMGSVLNIGGNYFSLNTSNPGPDIDKEALESDLEEVGKDFHSAFRKLQEGNGMSHEKG